MTFLLRAATLGFSAVRDAEICDAVPDGLTLERAGGSWRLRNGRVCWPLASFSGSRGGTITFRISPTASGTLVNRLLVTRGNAGRDRVAARLEVKGVRRRSRHIGITG